jgi:AcrR family transcriptional regulator
MRDPEKLKEEMDERNRKILDVAFELFVDKKIEAVSMGDIARAADVGRATLFRYYPSKLELVIAVCADQWKRYLDGLDARRPISSVHDIPAIDRLRFTMDSYIDMYQNHKALLKYNDNFNYYVTHEGKNNDQLVDFHSSLYSVDTRLHMMYEKARVDRHTGSRIHACHRPLHDDGLRSLCGGLHMGIGRQQGLHGRAYNDQGNDT